jgi:hypothetical protein
MYLVLPPIMVVTPAVAARLGFVELLESSEKTL